MGNLNAFAVRASLTLSALLLAACSGQNTFDRTTNPTKKYQDAIDHSQPWKPGMGPRQQPKDADNRQFFCGNDAFSLRLDNVNNGRRAEFHADAEGVHELTVVTNTKTKFNVTKVGGPKALQLRPISNDPSKFQLIWKPSREDAKSDGVKIVITDDELRQTCAFDYAEIINLVVDPGPGAPIVTIVDLPPNAIEYAPSQKFTVQVIDPAATPAKAPKITLGADQRQLDNVESKQLNVSADGAVFCEPGTLIDASNPTRWTFKCDFKMELLKGVEGFIKSPRTINAVFFAKAKSAGSGLDAAQVSGSVQVRFPVIEKKNETKDEVPLILGAQPITVAPAVSGQPGGLASGTDKPAKAAKSTKASKSNKTKPGKTKTKKAATAAPGDNV